METYQTYEIYCRFTALGKKVIKASSIEEAKKIAEREDHLEFSDIIRLIKPCKVDDKLSHQIDIAAEEEHEIEFRNWGSE